MKRILALAALCLVLALLVACGKTTPAVKETLQEPVMQTSTTDSASPVAAPVSADAAASDIGTSVSDVDTMSKDLDTSQMDLMDKDLAQVDNIDLG